MNLILFEQQDLLGPARAQISGRRLEHLLRTHKAEAGQSLRAGMLGGLQGQAQLLAIDRQRAVFDLQLDSAPPAKLPVTLVLALPRPKMLRRILQAVASLGVARLVVVNSYRVEKSFWQSPFLQPQAIREQLILGLEQARDTILPEVILEKRFKPFVEDRLAQLSVGSCKLVAHPGDYPPCPRELTQPVCLAVGPEGGWIEYEIGLLQQQGFMPVQMGQRILRVETAVTALLARLF